MLDINFNPPRRELQLFGGLWTPLFLSVIGGLLLYRQGAALLPVSIALWITAVVSLALSVSAPALLRPVYVGLIVVTYPLGWVMSHVIVALIFYGVVTPVGLVMRAVGRDPMHRAFDRSAKTYWTRHTPPADKRRYFRQY